MSRVQPQPQLHAGGTLIPYRHIYIQRPEDDELFKLLLDGEFCNVLTPRQLGKSSLMARTAFRLAERGIRYAALEIGGTLGSPSEADDWYLGLLVEIGRKIQLSLDVGAWWKVSSAETKNQKILRFFREEVLYRVETSVVIFLDEIDATLGLPYTDDLFTAIRTLYNERPFVPAYTKITFCLLGVANPNELIKNRKATPYNIGRTISLGDFKEATDDLSSLSKTLSDDPVLGSALLQRILYWTGGQPYLTVKLCQELHGALEVAAVDHYVERSFVDLERLATDIHFGYILDFLKDRVEDSVSTFRLYEKILSGAREYDRADIPHAQLKLSGLVKRGERGDLVVRNRIYLKLFDRTWLRSARSRPASPITRLTASILLLVTLGGISYFMLNSMRLPTLGHPATLLTRHSINSTIEGALSKGEIDTYEVDMRAGELIDFTVNQAGVDLIATVISPNHRKLLRVDSPIGNRGRERILFLAPNAGRYRIELRAYDPNATGRYSAQLDEFRAATVIDKRLAEAYRLLNEGRDFRRKTVFVEALERYESALLLFQSLGDFDGQTEALNELGTTYERLGRQEEALQVFRRALPLSKQEAGTLLRIGRLLASMGNIDEALAKYSRAYRLSQQVDNPSQAAIAAQELGSLYRIQNNTAQAVNFYEQALRQWQKAGSAQGEATTLYLRGGLYLDQDNLDLARRDFQEALSLLGAQGNSKERATILRSLGALYERRGDYLLAIDNLLAAQGIDRASGDRIGEMYNLLSLGAAYEGLGRLDQAMASFKEALSLAEKLRMIEAMAQAHNRIGDLNLGKRNTNDALNSYSEALDILVASGSRRGRTDALIGIAQAERIQGNLIAAKDYAARAVDSIDQLSAKQSGRAYKLYIDILMQAGSPGEALALFERSLLSRIPNGLAQGRIPLAKLPALDLPEIQSTLNSDTILLEYSLGEDRSFLWVVSPSSLHTFTLPNRALIEAMVRHKPWMASERRVQDLLIMNKLSETLLGPAAQLLNHKKLIFVSEGILGEIPFAALLAPQADIPKRPLVSDHEIICLPSVSMLAFLRQLSADRPLSPGALAIVADPIYSRNDPRVRTTVDPSVIRTTVDPSAKDNPGSQRLKRSRQEAEAILSLSYPQASLRMFDFSADKQAVLSGNLARYQILHFATHGLSQAGNPASSGILLSQFDEEGRPLDGFLSSSEIYRLRLPVELVVLDTGQTSSTASSAEQGETLSQAFLFAGAKRVVTGLWRVDDDAVVTFMERFYRSMQQGKHPAAALRQTQISFLKEERYRAPYYWAGFVFQGEWR